LQQANYDMLMADMQFEPIFIKEQLRLKWHCENGLVDSIRKIVDEYRTQRHLTVNHCRGTSPRDIHFVLLADQNLHSRSAGIRQEHHC
jgi:hypothetical protein